MRPTATMERPPHLPLASEELAAGVARALGATGHAALRDVQVASRDGVVVLSGHVPSYYLKQLAQHVALGVPGIQRIDNALEVSHHDPGRR